VIELLSTALAAVDSKDVQTATGLIDLAGKQVLEHLQRACEMSLRVHPNGRGSGRTYG
jgi:hypothetical protein